MIRFHQRGSTKNTMSFLKRIKSREYLKNLEKFGEYGVAALSAATPMDTGKTAQSWGYSIEIDDKGGRIAWTNSNANDGANVAILIQYGHGTRSGTYVEGIDYINPAMRPLFEELARNVWKEVTR